MEPHPLEASPIQKPPSRKQEAFKKAKKTVNKPAATRKNIPQATPPPNKKQVVKDVKNTWPDGFGYSVDFSASASISSVVGGFSFSVHGGTNYIVFTRGPHRWIPFRYAYYGYNPSFDGLNTPQYLSKAQQDVMEKAMKSFLRKAGEFRKRFSTDLTMAISPFIAWKDDVDNNVTPDSWAGWLIADVYAIKLKAGLGFSFGGSSICARTIKEGFQGSQEDLFDPYIWDVVTNYAKHAQYEDWYGYTLDIGVGAGTPAFVWSPIYPSYAKLQSEPLKWDTIPNKVLLYSWYEFLIGKGVTDDIRYLILQKAPVLVSFLLKKLGI